MTELALSNVARSSVPDVLAEIRDPDCNLAIWERDVLSSYANLLDPMPRDVRFESSVGELKARLEESLLEAGFCDGPEMHSLIEDVSQLAEKYASVMEARELEVRLEVVTTNSCRKWHADYVQARLITTYAGTGTQWLEASDALRVKDGLEPKAIGQMQVGDVGLFKGKLATDEPAIHRSPPIAGSGEKRLLLVLNPVERD